VSEGGPPAWLPASVGAAARQGSAGPEDLLSGDSWARLLDALARAGAVVAARGPGTPVDQAAGYRHLLVLLALGVDEALRGGDPYHPAIRPGNVDGVLKWGMDCPDAAYLGAPVRPDASYIVRGRRGTVRYLGFQVMGGMETLANVVADELELEADGSFELRLSAEEQPDNWMPLRPGAASLVVRQFFYDWDSEEPASLSIECTHRPEGRGARLPPPPLGADDMARQLEALGSFVDESLRFWLDIEESGRSEGTNRFRAPAAHTDIGGAAENVTVWGSWELADDDALVIEVTPPEALYWSVAVGNYWWESLDFAHRQTSLNGHQAVVDPDGVFRAVLCGRDPGLANWLDTAGNARGPMIFRWLRADGAPVPTTRVVRIAALDDALPAGTARVDPATRQRVLQARRDAVQRRYPR
jgi:Protein of unknown function (DUF1214)